MPGHGRWIAALAAVLAMVLAGCGASSPVTQTSPGPNTSVRAAIEGLLARYSAAMRVGDQAALRGVLTSDKPSFVTDQLGLQHNLQGLQTETFEYRLTSQVPSDPIARQQQWRLDAALTYAVAGVDKVPVQRPVTLGVRRDGDTWLIDDSTAAPVVWQFGPVVQQRMTVTGRDVVVVGHPGSAVMPRLSSEADSALRSLEDFWGNDWRAGLMLVAAQSDAEFGALIGGNHTDGVAAAAVADRVQDGTAVGQRMIFAPGSAGIPLDQFRVVLRHELFHVATRARTADHAPLWLVEGVADYNGRRGGDTSLHAAAPTLAAALADGRLPQHLPTDAELGTADAYRTQAYEQAWSLAQCVADTFGESSLKRLYEVGAESAERTQETPPAAEVAIRRVLGVDEAALVRLWQHWLTDRLR